MFKRSTAGLVPLSAESCYRLALRIKKKRDSLLGHPGFMQWITSYLKYRIRSFSALRIAFSFSFFLRLLLSLGFSYTFDCLICLMIPSLAHILPNARSEDSRLRLSRTWILTGILIFTSFHRVNEKTYCYFSISANSSLYCRDEGLSNSFQGRLPISVSSTDSAAQLNLCRQEDAKILEPDEGALRRLSEREKRGSERSPYGCFTHYMVFSRHL